MSAKLGRWTHVVLRVAAGLLFLQHGAQKLLGVLGGFGPAGGTVAVESLMGLTGVLELFGGVLLIIGLLTRPLALVLTAEMFAAYFMAHAPQNGWPIENQGELALLYAAVFMFLAGNGAGSASLDAWIASTSARDRRRHDIEDRRIRVAA